MYYRASVCLATEDLWLNPETNCYEGCDPDTYQVHGQVKEIKAPTLLELRAKIEKEFYKLSKPIGADIQIFENRINISDEGEHHYNTPKIDQIPFVNNYSIYITRIEEIEVNLSEESVFSDVERY